MRLGISVARPNLISLGTCFGKFTKSGKFMLHISALDYLAQYAKFKVGPNFLRASRDAHEARLTPARDRCG